jgi:hypothetical protein
LGGGVGKLGAVLLLRQQFEQGGHRSVNRAQHFAGALRNRGEFPGGQAIAAFRTSSGSGGMGMAPGTCRRSPR